MAVKLDLDPRDDRELFRIRRELCGWRQALDMTQVQLAEKIERSESFVYEMEKGRCHYRLSSLQQWASGFDLRVDPILVPDEQSWQDRAEQVATVPAKIWDEHEMMEKMSRPFDATSWVRLWLVQRLVLERTARKMSSEDLAVKLGLSRGAITAWELNCHDPLMGKLFTYARAVGCEIRFGLVERQDWASLDGGHE